MTKNCPENAKCPTWTLIQAGHYSVKMLGLPLFPGKNGYKNTYPC